MALLPHLRTSRSAAAHMAAVVPSVRFASGQSQRKPNRPKLSVQDPPRVEEDQASLAVSELLDGPGGLDPLALDGRDPSEATAFARGIALKVSYPRRASPPLFVPEPLKVVP